MDKQVNIGRMDMEISIRFDQVKVALFKAKRKMIKSPEAFEFMLVAAEKMLGIFDSKNEIDWGLPEWRPYGEKGLIERDGKIINDDGNIVGYTINEDTEEEDDLPEYDGELDEQVIDVDKGRSII